MSQKPTNPNILMIGTVPPPLNGQSIAFKMLVDGLVGNTNISIIDISSQEARRDKSFSILRAFHILKLVFEMFGLVRGCGVVYLTVAQSHYGFLRDAVLLWVAHLSKTPTVVHLHGGNYSGFYASESWLIRKIIQQTMMPVTRFVVLSENLRDQFDFLGKDIRRKVVVVPNGCAVSISQSKKQPKKTLNLLYLSNLLIEKGFMDCLDALLHVQRQLPELDVRLTLAGEFLLGEDEYSSVEQLQNQFEKHVRYLGLADKVKYVGTVRGEAKENLLLESDLFILPTYYINEGQPLSIIEAMAFGLPVISTKWRGIKEMITEGETGFLVPEKSPLDIANAIVRIINTPALYETMSQNAISSVDNFSVGKHTDLMRALFFDVIATSKNVVD